MILWFSMFPELDWSVEWANLCRIPCIPGVSHLHLYQWCMKKRHLLSTDFTTSSSQINHDWSRKQLENYHSLTWHTIKSTKSHWQAVVTLSTPAFKSGNCKDPSWNERNSCNIRGHHLRTDTAGTFLQFFTGPMLGLSSLECSKAHKVLLEPLVLM